MDMHMDGAWDTFWIKSKNGTFIALEIKSFGPKKIKYHPRVKKCHFGNFSEWAWMALKNPSQELKKYFFLGTDEYIERLEGKIRECLFCYVKLF